MTTTDYKGNGEMEREKEEKQQAYPTAEKHKVEKNHSWQTCCKEKWGRIFSGKEENHGQAGRKPWLKPGILLVIGIFLMCLSSVLSGSISGGESASNAIGQDGAVSQNLPNYMQIEQQLEAKLERTIGGVAGVDHVLVSVTLDSSMAKDYAVDVATVSKTQQESDAGGVQRVIAEQTDNQQLVLEKGGATPIVIKESMPKVRGVAVVATGVDNAATREEVFHIVQGLLDVPAHKIIITNGKGKE